MYAIQPPTRPRFRLEHKRSSHIFEICLPPEVSSWMKQTVVVSFWGILHDYTFRSVYMSLSTLVFRKPKLAHFIYIYVLRSFTSVLLCALCAELIGWLGNIATLTSLVVVWALYLWDSAHAWMYWCPRVVPRASGESARTWLYTSHHASGYVQTCTDEA